MSRTSWKRCTQCGRKQSIRYKPALCGGCDSKRRAKERRAVRRDNS